MRYCLVADARGSVQLVGRSTYDYDGFHLELSTDVRGMLKHIALSVAVPADRIVNLVGAVAPGQDGAVLDITFGGDRDLHAIVVNELQRLESDLSFLTGGALTKIDWHTPTIKIIPENDEERERLAVYQYQPRKTYRPPHARLSDRAIRDICDASHTNEQINVAKAFWREGMNSFRQFRYIQSFYAFYFIVEDFYADGKTGEHPVLREFLSSQEFREVVGSSFDTLLAEGRHAQNLRILFEQWDLDEDLEGMARLLFRLRGSLHHYSSRSSMITATPFNQADFESVALLLMHIATTAIDRRSSD